MALSYTTANRNNQLDEITSDIGASGLLRIYDGTPPGSVNDALAGNTLLAELALSATAAAAAAGGQLTFNAIADDTSANATGTASFWRLLTSAAAAVVQGTAGTSGADINFDSVSFVIGGTVSVTSLVFTGGNP